MYTAKQAMRAVYRILHPIMQAQEVAWACDRQYDGGEWSAAGHARYADDIERRTVAYVSQRMGVDTDDIVAAMWEATNTEVHHYFN